MSNRGKFAGDHWTTIKYCKSNRRMRGLWNLPETYTNSSPQCTVWFDGNSTASRCSRMKATRSWQNRTHWASVLGKFCHYNNIYKYFKYNPYMIMNNMSAYVSQKNLKQARNSTSNANLNITIKQQRSALCIVGLNPLNPQHFPPVPYSMSYHLKPSLSKQSQPNYFPTRQHCPKRPNLALWKTLCQHVSSILLAYSARSRALSTHLQPYTSEAWPLPQYVQYGEPQHCMIVAPCIAPVTIADKVR